MTKWTCNIGVYRWVQSRMNNRNYLAKYFWLRIRWLHINGLLKIALRQNISSRLLYNSQLCQSRGVHNRTENNTKGQNGRTFKSLELPSNRELGAGCVPLEPTYLMFTGGRSHTLFLYQLNRCCRLWADSASYVSLRKQDHMSLKCRTLRIVKYVRVYLRHVRTDLSCNPVFLHKFWPMNDTTAVDVASGTKDVSSTSSLKSGKSLHGGSEHTAAVFVPGHEESTMPEDKKEEILDVLEDDWISDPENARNWPTYKKWVATAIVRWIIYGLLSILTHLLCDLGFILYTSASPC